MESISIDDIGCKGFGITILNCHPSTVKVGQGFPIVIAFDLKLVEAEVKHTLKLKNAHLSQEFEIQFNAPPALLRLMKAWEGPVAVIDSSSGKVSVAEGRNSNLLIYYSVLSLVAAYALSKYANTYYRSRIKQIVAL